MIVITATFKSVPGKEQELEEILRGMITNVQQEAGTVMYSLNRSATDKGKFSYIEKYKDQEALNYHSSQPYFKELGRNIKGLVEGRAAIEIYEEIASINR